MVQIFLKEDGANAASLAEKLNGLVQSINKDGKELKGFVIFTDGDKEKIEKIAADKKIENIGLAYLQGGKDVNGTSIFQLYKVNPEAKNTVIVYRNKKVSANFVDLDAKDFSKVEKAAKEVVG